MKNLILLASLFFANSVFASPSHEQRIAKKLRVPIESVVLKHFIKDVGIPKAVYAVGTRWICIAGADFFGDFLTCADTHKVADREWLNRMYQYNPHTL